MTRSAPPKVGFERILVPIDFTDISRRALDYAKSIARLNESTLFLVHANEGANPTTSPEVVWFEQLTVQGPEEQQLKTQAAELHSQGPRAKAISLSGAIQHEVLATAEKENADLIVLGTHARTGLPRFLFRSDAEAMYRNASCPILVIGPEARPLPVFPLPNCDQPWLLRNVICACDLNPASAPMVAFAHRLAQDHGAGLTIFHVDASQGQASKNLQIARFQRALQPLLLGDPMPEILWRTIVIGHNVGAAIAHLAFERDADLIVMGANVRAQRQIGRTTVPQVLAKAACPVMVLHRE
jgi:nucleotide-binding universal stress UspA family protein